MLIAFYCICCVRDVRRRARLLFYLFLGQISVLACAHVAGLPDLKVRQPRLPVVAELDAPLGEVQILPLHHFDALDHGADRVAERAAGTGIVLHLVCEN